MIALFSFGQLEFMKLLKALLIFSAVRSLPTSSEAIILIASDGLDRSWLLNGSKERLSHTRLIGQKSSEMLELYRLADALLLPHWKIQIPRCNWRLRSSKPIWYQLIAAINLRRLETDITDGLSIRAMNNVRDLNPCLAVARRLSEDGPNL